MITMILVDMAGRHLFGRHTAQIEQRKAEGRRQERGLQVDRNHDRHPAWIEGAAIDHRPHDGHDDVDDLQEIQHEAQDEQHQHHDQEGRDLVVEAAQEALDVMLAPEGDQHKVQDLAADQDGKDHRGDLGGLAHHRAQHAPAPQHPAGIEEAEHGEAVGKPCAMPQAIHCSSEVTPTRPAGQSSRRSGA
jgi:hypothetical protein